MKNFGDLAVTLANQGGYKCIQRLMRRPVAQQHFDDSAWPQRANAESYIYGRGFGRKMMKRPYTEISLEMVYV